MAIRDPRIDPHVGDHLLNDTQRVLVTATEYNFLSDTGQVSVYVSPLEPFVAGAIEAFQLKMPLSMFRQQAALLKATLHVYSTPE